MDNGKMIESIRTLCKNKNITPTKLEEELGFSQGLIGRWKDKNPNLDRIIDIADYFQVSIDEVVGRNYFNNEFINKLITETKRKSIEWNEYDESSHEPKQYYDKKLSKKNGGKLMTSSDIDYYTFHFKEISFFSVINNGYISIYGQYDDNKITSPNNIKLFIQPSNDAKLIEQKYSDEELYILWLNVLRNIDKYCPDEIKAEELKNQFVLNDSKTNSKHGLSKNTNMSDVQKLLSNPDIIRLMEVYNQPEFQQLQKTFSNPEFQAAIQVANKLQHYFNKNN